MVGVSVVSEDDLSSANSPMIKFMLKERENHARNQVKDYSHVFRRKTRFEMFRLSAIAIAIEFAYAAETAFVSPILLQIGIDHKHMTLTWGLSPIIGFFVSPLLGSISDRCKFGWGRRRPIITLLSLGILFGLIMVPHGRTFGSLLGDQGYEYPMESIFTNNGSNSVVEALVMPAKDGPSPSDYKYAVILTILGMVLLDFSADTCQTPARTYMLDMCTPEDQPRSMTTFSLFAGCGGTVGYAIGGIDWEQTQFGNFLGGNIPTVFGLVTIIFIICYIITITTFREIPLKLIEKDSKLRPLSATAIKKELNKNNNAIYYIKETTLLELEMATSTENDLNLTELDIKNDLSATDCKKPLPATNLKEDIELNDTTDEKPISLAQYMKSIFVMPSSMAILAATNLFCWMAHVIYALYFTDFVGEAVFGGDPMAPPHSDAAKLYESGIRFGCFGLSVYAFSCSIYSLSVTKLMKMFGTKIVYISGILYYGVGMLILGLFPTKWGVLVFSTSAGVLYGTVFTMPYILVASYHSKNCFKIRNGETVPLKQTRGLGTDVAIISSVVFVAQLIVALFIGPLVSWMETTCAILYASSVIAFISAICAMFILYI